MADTLLRATESGVATLTFNRPASLNALNSELAAALVKTIKECEQDPQVRVVVLQGAGGNFMSGGDVTKFHKELATLRDPATGAMDGMFDDVHNAIEEILTMKKPVIASVAGACAGFGLSLMASCDLSVVGEDALFSVAYTLIGTTPDGGSTYILPRVLGVRRAMELILLSERFDAHKALEIGLINRVVPANELAEATTKLARRLATGPATAYAGAKQLVNNSLQRSLRDQLTAEEDSFRNCVHTADFEEGVAAFCEKRKPKFG